MQQFSLEQALDGISERYTPEMREKDEARNVELRGHIDPNSATNRIGRATAQMNVILEQIEFLKTQPQSELKDVRMTNAVNHLGELFAEQGNYAEAINVTEDPRRRREYEATMIAIDVPDDAVCACTDDKAVNKNADVILPTRIESGQIVADGKILSVLKCWKCGFRNAR